MVFHTNPCNFEALSFEEFKIHMGLRFSPGSLVFSPEGLHFSPRGLRFSSGGLGFSPRGLGFSSGGLRFSPGGLRFSPRVFVLVHGVLGLRSSFWVLVLETPK